MSDTDKTEALRPDAALNEMLYMALRDAQTLGDKSRVEAAAAVIRAALAQRQEVPSDHRTVWDRPCYKCRMTTCDGSSCAAPPAQQQEANNDEVICPSCAHQFRAIPVNVQRLMLEAGFEPPFTEPPADASWYCEAVNEMTRRARISLEVEPITTTQPRAVEPLDRAACRAEALEEAAPVLSRAAEMLTAYAELVKATGKYAEMHYVPEIEYHAAAIRELK